ncbi:hypothetical protein ACOMHN_000366 [Nucella lapillus]
MLLNRRGIRDSASGPARSVSRAQFQSAMIRRPQSRCLPANRLLKSSVTFDSAYSQFENTSLQQRRHSDDVVLPPVHSPVKNVSSGRRLGPRGKLPTVKGDEAARSKVCWYHEDGALNLQALLNLTHKHSCPRTQTYYARLEKLKARGWTQPKGDPSPRYDDPRLIPLQHDPELTPKSQESLLNLLLSTDDLTEHELEEIARYISDPPGEDSTCTSRSCLRTSACPKSDKKSKRSKGSYRESAGSKSVRFRHTSTSTRTQEQATSPQASPLSGSPRPRTAPSSRSQFSPSPVPRPRKFSDPFHVASPPASLSPRVLGSPDEVAYLHDMESSPEVPASPEHILQPKVTYYDESGEEIEEDIQTRDPAREGRGTQGRATLCDDAASCPEEFPPSDSERLYPVSEADPPDPLSELDTPRVTPDPADAHESQQSQSCPADLTSAHAGDDSMSESCDSPREVVSTHPTSPNEDDTDMKHCSTSASRDQDISPSPLKEVPYERPKSEIPEPHESSTPGPETPRPESAPPEQSRSHTRRKSRPKSSKRPKSSRSDSRPTQVAPKSSSTDHRSEKKPQKPQHPQTLPDASADTRPHPERSEPSRDYPHDIPIFSLSRGQLQAVPPYSPRIQTPDSPDLDPEPGDLTGSAQGQPQGCSVQEPPGSSLDNAPQAGRGRGKDHRMKVWLTRTAWNRDVECPE